MPPTRVQLRAVVLSASILLSFAATPAFAQVVKIGDEEKASIETAHPYAGGDPTGRIVWSETLSWPEASYIAVHFDRFELAKGDTLVLSDPAGRYRHSYSGRGHLDKGGNFWGLSILGSTMQLTLVSTNPQHQAFGLNIDRWVHGYPTGADLPETDSLCGTEDFLDVECYADSYPEEYDKARAVVRLIKGGSGHCTGWLVSCENHILTNQHCVASQSELDGIELQFEYKRPGCGTGTATTALQLHGGTLLEVDSSLDYALLMPQLDGNDPQATFGHLQVETRLPDIDETMYIVHHPSGDPKRISVESSDSHDESGRCEVYSTDQPACTSGAPVPDIGYYCDTEGGSSGSPVISAETHKVIALHHCASCPNRGVPIVDVYNSLQASDHPLPACSTCDSGQAASNLVAVADGDNRIQLSWSLAADAVNYHVYRSRQGCSSGMEHIATTAATNYLDEQASGGVNYSYTIRAVNDCGGEATPTNCEGATTTGGCLDQPLFDGLSEARNEKLSSCSIALSWNSASPRCGSAVRYNIYRSPSAGFEPAPTNRVATCLDATSWKDSDILSGQRYHYIVRAEDNSGDGTGPCALGNEDQNAVEQVSIVTGPDQVYFSSDFESPAGWELLGEWEIGAPGGRGGSAENGSGSADPSAAFSGAQVLGLDLSGMGSYGGNYENSISAFEYATSPVFDASTQAEAFLRFQRWLGVERSSYDQAVIEVFDGSAWQTIYQNPNANISDDAWNLEEIDASEYLAGVSAARLRFGIKSDGSVIYAGWNVDSLEIFGGGSCSSNSSPTGVGPVPDGDKAGGTPMTASRGAATGEIEVQWDTLSCPATAYHLLHADSDQLSSYDYAGSSCTLNSSGNDTVAIPAPLPGHFSWWVVIAADSGEESIHGFTGSGAPRPADGTGFCGITQQSTATVCP